MPQFYRCQCFFNNNIFLKKYKMHVNFRDNSQFWNDYLQFFNRNGCITDEEKQEILTEVNKEINRRTLVEDESLQRQAAIKESYHPLHREVYNLQESFLHPEFLKLVDQASKSKCIQDLVPYLNVLHSEKRVYSFPVFTDEFCRKFLEELENFEKFPISKGQPNTMNKYGVLLNDLGFDENFLNILRTRYIQPVASVMYPEWCGHQLDSHRAFTVSYKIGHDEELNFHFDNAEVTLNVCLGCEFTGGELYFGDMRTVPLNESTCSVVAHKPGCGILHRGQHLHGALPISSGERHNLVIWLRSSYIRNWMCPMCDNRPDFIPAVDYGDGFTDIETQTVNMCCTL